MSEATAEDGKWRIRTRADSTDGLHTIITFVHHELEKPLPAATLSAIEAAIVAVVQSHLVK